MRGFGAVHELDCLLCHRRFEPGSAAYTCPDCGDEGILDVKYDYAKIQFDPLSPRRRKEASLWRYLPLLPLDKIPPLSLNVGWTPLYRYPGGGFEGSKGGCKLFIKDDSRNPTASLKDRASAIGVGRALIEGAERIVCASTGNAASSVAGLAANAGVPTAILVPETIPQAKLAQLLIFGARVIRVRQGYHEAYRMSLELSRRFGWYNRNCAYNPYLVEGKKTVSLEIAEQLDWSAPDLVFVPLGDGCILSGVRKGFHDLVELGVLSREPRLVGVQAKGCAPLVKAFLENRECQPCEPNTLADSIAVPLPRNRLKATAALRSSKGTMLAVSDEEILSAMRRLGRELGVFAEPAGATAFAGALRWAREGRLSGAETAVAIVTGSGLKDVAAALQAVEETPVVQDFAQVVELLAE